MFLPVTHSLVVQADEELRLLRFQWAAPSTDPIRPALVWGRDLVVRHQPTRALVDFTGLPPIEFLDEIWMARHWVPIIAAQSLHQAALVFRNRHHRHNQLVIETLLWVARRQVRFQFQLFDDVPSALHWLTESAEAVRRLQAEWATGAPVARR